MPPSAFKPIRDLNFGFADAENYRRRENRDLFNRIFFRTESLERLCERGTFFLLGEKGTGKTAYGVYFSNTSYKSHVSMHKYIRETEYHKFVSMKRTNNLDLSDYTNIWKVIIYLLFAEHIATANRETNLFTRFRKFRALKDAIDAYYSHAFSPEIINALQFVESSGSSAKILAKYAEAGMDEQARYELNASQFQTNLLFIQKQFQDAFTSLKLSFDYLLFIDGIDIRPNSIDYADYLQCIRGLANAVWSVNSDFFPSIRDSKGRLRTILLVRPDIFNSLGLQNRNTKLRDNSVLLDWRTNYETYRSSAIFEISDRMLRVQQNGERMAGETWDHYFPFDATSVRSEQMLPSAFIIFLRYSFYRPRDVITMLSILQSVHLSRTDNAESVFSYDELMSPEFRNPYSDYLLGEVRDQLVFYYSDMDFDAFLKFFQFLYGMTRFDYEAYVNAFAEWEGWMDTNLEERPDFAASAEGFLQFLYDLNVVSFTEEAEDEKFIRWCFRERSPTNISPKVRLGVSYEIHYGLQNALNTGKPLRGRGRMQAEAGRRAVPRGGGAAKRMVRHRGEVIYVHYAKRLVVLKLEGKGGRVVAPQGVLTGPGRRLLRKGRLLDVLCVEEAGGGTVVGELRAEQFVWSSSSSTWKEERR